MALFFVFLMVAVSVTPLGQAYALLNEKVAEFDPTTSKQPAPLENLEQKEIIDPITRNKLKPEDMKRDEVDQAAKDTASLKDPIKAYAEEQAEEAKTKPKVLENKEIYAKRTATTRTYANDRGGETERIFSEPVNFKKDGKWQSIEGELKTDVRSEKIQSNLNSFQLDNPTLGKVFVKKSAYMDEGFFKLGFKPLKEEGGPITLSTESKQPLKITPQYTSDQVNPSVKTSDDGRQYVEYLNAWKSTDLFYEQRGEALKEFIKLNAPDAPSEFTFKVEGGDLKINKDASGKPDGTITATLPDKSTVLIPQLSLSSMRTGPISNPPIEYVLKGNAITVSIDRTWLKSQPASSFPLVIDPSYVYSYNTAYHSTVPGGNTGQFIAYKSDGYKCNSYNCEMNVGTLNDNGAKSWRTMLHLPFSDVYGKPVVWANIYTRITTNPYIWPGFAGSRPYNATWANCFGFNCVSGAPRATGNINGDGNLNATALAQWLSGNNVGDGWLTMWAANEADVNSFKALSAANTFLDVTYQWNVDHPNQPTPLPTLTSPEKDAVIVVERPTLKVSPVTDPDGDQVRYAFRVMDSRGNVVAYSPELDTPSWTLPAKVLTDGEKYSWNVWVLERRASDPSQVENGWRPSDETRSFKYTTRLNKDQTQSYDDVGAASINMNTGNVYSHSSSHSISALGGEIGIGFDYNSTLSLAHNGINGRYYSGEDYGTTITDPNIDMDWGGGSPMPGSLSADNFNVDWGAYFIAPQDGNYIFGSNTDGAMSLGIGNYDNNTYVSTSIFSNTGAGKKWATTSIYMKKGSAYGLDVRYQHASGNAYASLIVRTPDGVEQVVKSDWLKTTYGYGQRVGNSGLSAKFYKNIDPATNSNFVINDKTPLVYATNVPQVNTDWGSNSLVPTDPLNQYADNVIVNYSGYLTIPISGDYQFGGTADDGLRIRLGGNQVFNQDFDSEFSSAIHFNAGQIVPIQVDYYEETGAASVSLQWQGPAGNEIIPGAYLTNTAKIVPGNWQLSVNPSGNVAYQSLSAKPSGDVELTDSTGFVHTYTWSGGGYKPPVNEEGYLVRNNDSTFTLTDISGTVYNYAADGRVTSVSTPADDKRPSGLRYEYQNTSASTYTAIPKLSKIIDGVDPSRYGQLYYWGESGSDAVCTVATGYSAPPDGYLCAFKTFPDNKVTKLHYQTSMFSDEAFLSRIEKPGNQLTDYAYNTQYDPAGQIFTIRDSVANDAIMAGTRNRDSSTTTTINYDGLLRATSYTRPKPFGSTVPVGQVNPPDYQRDVWYEYGVGFTKKHFVNAAEPKGYSQYLEYDNLFRTTKACDYSALCTTTAWDPSKDMALSFTDTNGMMSTTIYDEDDRPIEQYGAAPAAWFGTDRKPLSTYAAQIPKSTTAYDENINAPAVAWYGARGETLFGVPKLHTTGIDNADQTHIGKSFVPAGAVPITTDSTTPGYGFSATGKIKFPAAGLYTFNIKHDDGVQLFIDDKSILDDKWTTRTAGATLNSDEATFNAEANKLYRFRLDYIHFDDGAGAGSIDAWLRGPGITDISGTGLGTNKFGLQMTPAYGLATSSTTTDSTLGTTTYNTTYQDAAYGTVSSSSIDSAGFNYKGAASYEAQGVGYLRQTSKTLPGGNSTTYSYYSDTAAVDNPCTVAADAVSQAGRLQYRTEPDPDGTGPLTARKTQTVYDSTGRVAAARLNTDGWTCTTYDERSRVTNVTVPDARDASNIVIRKGNTINTNYAVAGNPMVTSSTDTIAGTTTTETDLLGRIIRTVDVFGNTTSTFYDNQGRLTSRTSPAGTESLSYDTYNRLSNYKLDNVIYASVVYDALGRIGSVEYPQSKNAAGTTLKLEQVKYDSRQRNTGAIYRFADATAYDETLTLSSSGLVLTSTDKLNTTQAISSYSYDKANRLTQAIVDKMKYTYDFSAPSATTCNQTGTNLNAHKNTNRTSFKATNVTTSIDTINVSYCYNMADQLTKSTDTQIGTPTYDAHGNTTTLSGAGTPINFVYDSMDRNTEISQGTNKVAYTKAVDGSILRKKEYQNNILTKSYRYLADGKVIQSCSLTNDNTCTTTDTYLGLPGNVITTLSPTNPDTSKRAIYTLKNFHGDAAVTAGSNGLSSSSVNMYEPFGRASQSETFGTNSNPVNASDKSMGWAADPTRKAETSFTIPIIQMGSRVYLPTAGRFLQVDPVEGGTPNPYTYVGDPINDNDYSGNFSFSGLINKIVHIITTVVRQVVQAVTAVIRAVASIPAVVARVASTSGGGSSNPKAVSAGKSTASFTFSGQTRSTYNGVPSADMFIIPTEIPRGTYTSPFNTFNAVSNASDYSAIGGVVGAVVGCAAGAIAGGAGGFFAGVAPALPLAGLGCATGGTAGTRIGGIVGSGVGIVIGGFGLPGKDAFSWGPDLIMNPFKI